jgi:DnaJ-class molecular chaperone
MADYYDILGVPRHADEKEIRQAYRRLARQHHPDVNPSDEASAERFKTINAAYEVLSDSDKRAKYDRYGDRWEQAEHFEQRGGPGPDFSQFFRGGNSGGGDFDRGRGGFTFTAGGGTISDLLGGLGGFASDRGGNTGNRFRSRPADVPIEVTLEEVDRGATRLVNLPDGRRLEVKIPAGIADGGRVHIAAGNDAGGEFNLLVSVLLHDRFGRQGDDLHTTVDVPLVDAVLGGTAQVQTLRGRIELTLPPET